jgi:hypothetical protein
MAFRLSLSPEPQVRRRRRLVFASMVLLVAGLHTCTTKALSDRMEAFAASADMPARLAVAYVRTLEPEAPPVAAPAPPRATTSRALAAAAARAAAAAVPRPAPPASAAAEAELPQAALATAVPASEPQPLAVAEAEAAAAMAAPADPSAAPAEAAAASGAAAEGAPAGSGPSAEADRIASGSPGTADQGAGATPGTFDWPASTRVSYVLTGSYRGDVSGSAQVEWIRSGSRYQVHLDVVVGPSMAPLITRRMSSEGELTADGLVPNRYDEQTDIVLRERRRNSIVFQGDHVVLANGEQRERWRGVQDTASQFIQLTYRFTTEPSLLRVGGEVEVPLALPKKVDRWIYDVVDEVVLQTPFGALATFHLKPRRAQPKSGDLNAEIWFAPQLRYLPVRIRIEQDPQSYVDLMIARKPELAR